MSFKDVAAHQLVASRFAPLLGGGELPMECFPGYFPWSSKVKCARYATFLRYCDSLSTSLTVLGAACIIGSLSVIRGPLNQRAVTVLTGSQFPANGSVTAHIAQELPNGYTGITLQSRAWGSKTAALTSSFTEVMRQYSQRTDIHMNHTNCGDPCLFDVKVSFSGNSALSLANSKNSGIRFQSQLFR
jgi:hypothetical protein